MRQSQIQSVINGHMHELSQKDDRLKKKMNSKIPTYPHRSYFLIVKNDI